MHGYAFVLVLFGFILRLVSCAFTSVSFSSVEQCGSLQVNFSATPAPDFPLTLNIVPFLATPIYIPIPFSSWDNSTSSGTARITFLPFNAGTQFLASIDSADGKGSLVSDVLAVTPSNNTFCIPQVDGNPFQNAFKNIFYMIHGLLNQCSHFNVSFDPSIIDHPPTIRAFVPRNTTYLVNASSNPPVTVTTTVHGNSSNPFGGGNPFGFPYGNFSNNTFASFGNITNNIADFSNTTTLKTDTKSKSHSNNTTDSKGDQDDKGDDDKGGDKGDDGKGDDKDDGDSSGDSDNHGSDDNGTNGSGGNSDGGDDDDDDDDDGDNANDNSSKGGGGDDQHTITLTLQEYILDIVHGSQAVLLLDDGAGHQQTSLLFTAGGNTGSSSSCVKELNLGTPSSDTDSSKTARHKSNDPLSKTAKLIIGVLGGCIFLIIVAVIILLVRLRVFKKPRWLSRQSNVKTFVFTEDIDMGSSIVARVRSRFSQFMATSASRLTGRRTPWSFRGDRSAVQGQEQRSSYGLLTSPRVSLILSINRTMTPSEERKTQSWTSFMNEYLGPNNKGVSDAEKQDLGTEKEVSEPLTSPRRSLDAMSQITLPTPVHTRVLNPDVPLPAITGSQILFGSAYLPSRSSVLTTSTAQVIQSPAHRASHLFSPKIRQASDGERISFSNVSSSGYIASNVSSGSSSDGEEYYSRLRPSIYVSPPIKPVSDFELLASSMGLAQNGLRKDAGRVHPFPITPRRNQDS